MAAQFVAHHHRKRQRRQHRGHVHAGEDDGRTIDPPDAVAKRLDASYVLPYALYPLPCHRQMKKAQVSS